MQGSPDNPLVSRHLERASTPAPSSKTSALPARSRPQVTLDDVLSRRVLILAGKGGVGKSVLAAALGWMGAREGKRILLVEMDTVETLPGLLGSPGGPTYTEIPLAPNLSCLHVDGRSGLEEYLQLVLKSRRLAGRIFRSPLYQYFVNVAPGLKELMAVGKIWDLEHQTLPGTGRPRYDLFIVDMPATGHAVSYLRMPMAAVSTLKRGFVHREAQKVADLLQDPRKTSFNIVTLPSEMPVTEALELYEKARFELRMPIGCLFVNQVVPPFYSGESLERFNRWKAHVEAEIVSAKSALPRTVLSEKELLACAESWRKRRELQEGYLERMRKVFPNQILHLPWLPGMENPRLLVERLAQCLAAEARQTRRAEET